MTSETKSATISRTEELRASPPLFRSRTLDRLTRVHPAVPVVIFGPAVGALVAAGGSVRPFWTCVLYVAIGYVLWTLTEYWMHRVVFHFEPEDGLGARLHHLIHGVHHDHPNDPRRLVMPPSVSVPLSGAFVLLFRALFGPELFLLVSAGFLGGYLIYDMTHYALHHHVPRTRLGRWLRELHMRHHFSDASAGYGISAPYWDWVFGTALRRGRAGPRDAR